ncbi:hypothetical protein CR513_24943, partial [Mucuna pruriens]
MKESKIEKGIRCNMTDSSSFVTGSLLVFNRKLFDNWRSLVKTYSDGEKNKKVKLQTMKKLYGLLEMKDSKSISNYFDRIQELVNAMRAYKEKISNQQVVDKILRTLPQPFDHVVVAIEESKNLDTMEIKELQHSLEVHEMRVKKRKVIQEQVLQALTNYKVKDKGPWKGNKSNTKIKNLVKLVNLLKKGGQTNHKSKVASPKTARSGKKNRTWELVDPPSYKKLIALKWVYKVKVNPRGEVVKNKKAEIDYGELYALVVKIATIRLVVVVAINASWSMHQLNVKSAFSNGSLEEEVYVDQLLGFVVKGKENKVYKLKKVLNKHQERINDYLSHISLKKCTSEHGVYVKCWKGSMKSEKLLECLYVDDLLITNINEVEIASFKK